MEFGTVAGALVPPVGSRVDHGVDTSLGVVGVGEVLDPSDHGSVAETVAGGSRRVVLDIEHTGESFSITGPATAVGEEVLGLGGTRTGGWMSKVVATTDEASSGSAGVVLREGGVNDCGSFSGLY